jgi:putative endonuclease
MSWFIYILQCNDNSLYTGVTNDLDRRIAAHNGGTGAKYTKGRGPVTLLYSEASASRSDAQKREYSIKQLSRAEKVQLLKTSPFKK